jgi:hypothetical protein
VTNYIQFRLWPTILGLVLAIHLCKSAVRDEKNGFSYTAALEWREAAELSASIKLLADCCWREWERIMHLPRSFAFGSAHWNQASRTL